MNLFNRMMNAFEAHGSFAIIGKVYALYEKRVVTFILVQQTKFPSYCKKKTTTKLIWFCRLLLVLLMLLNNFTK